METNKILCTQCKQRLASKNAYANKPVCLVCADLHISRLHAPVFWQQANPWPADPRKEVSHAN